MRSAPSALRGLFASSLPVLAAVIVTIAAPAPVAAARDETREAWLDMVRRAQVWRRGDVAAKDLAARRLPARRDGGMHVGATRAGRRHPEVHLPAARRRRGEGQVRPRERRGLR